MEFFIFYCYTQYVFWKLYQLLFQLTAHIFMNKKCKSQWNFGGRRWLWNLPGYVFTPKTTALDETVRSQHVCSACTFLHRDNSNNNTLGANCRRSCKYNTITVIIVLSFFTRAYTLPHARISICTILRDINQRTMCARELQLT